MTVVCDKYLSLGLFGVEEGSLWDITEIRLNDDDVKESVVRLKEKVFDFKETMCIEIPQRILALNFSIQ